MHMLGICCIYTSSRFNSYSIKLVTLKLYNYNSLKNIIIRGAEKYFIKRLNSRCLGRLYNKISGLKKELIYIIENKNIILETIEAVRILTR